jgi:hypothetical protein
MHSFSKLAIVLAAIQPLLAAPIADVRGSVKQRVSYIPQNQCLISDQSSGGQWE